jgi:hypothetical protein
MDIQTARQVVRTAFGTCFELQALLPVLKDRCSAEEYNAYALGIASAIDCIGDKLTNMVLRAHPEIAGEIEARIATNGRF